MGVAAAWMDTPASVVGRPPLTGYGCDRLPVWVGNLDEASKAVADGRSRYQARPAAPMMYRNGGAK
jgi:hypothetical protein